MFGVLSLVSGGVLVELSPAEAAIARDAVKRRWKQLKAEYVSVSGQAREFGHVVGWGGALKRREEWYRAAIEQHEALVERLGVNG